MSTSAEDLGKSTVAGVRRIAHDLRGPLNAMRLSLDLLRRGLDRGESDGNESRREHMKQIERIERQINTMNDVLSREIERALEHEGKES